MLAFMLCTFVISQIQIPSSVIFLPWEFLAPSRILDTEDHLFSAIYDLIFNIFSSYPPYLEAFSITS